MDFKIELIPIAVTDIDRTKDFYASIGWEADQDHTVTDDLRFVQVTPPGSSLIPPARRPSWDGSQQCPI